MPESVLPSPRCHRAEPEELHETAPGERQSIEQFIQGRFEEAFNSRISAFMPRLVSLRNPDGSLRAALGLRYADQPLFLEQYLDSTIEHEIATRIGRPCARETVVEVGQLSGTYPGAVRRMIELLTRRLNEEGVMWVAFTGTAALRNAFHRMGLSPIEIAVASRDRLPDAERAAWGRYYDDGPRVFFGNVQQGLGRLNLPGTPGAAAQMLP